MTMDYIIPCERDGSASTTMVERHDSDGSIRFIPLVDDNRDAEQFRAWLAAGGRPTQAQMLEIAPAPIAFLEFMALFEPSEQAALVNSQDTRIRLFLLQASGAGEIDLADPRVKAAFDYLTGAGVLEQRRAAAILGAATP
jgi:hypothetical protein